MSTFVSLVGKQPAAVAVALRSWMQARPGSIHRVVLLATPTVREIAKRLKQWSQTSCHVPCECLDISEGLVAEADLLPPADLIRDWLACQPLESRDVIFNSGPGFNFHVVTLQQALPPEAYTLYPLAGRLCLRALNEMGQEIWRDLAPVDIALEPLLRLHGISFKIEGWCSPYLHRKLKGQHMDKAIVKGLRLDNANVTFDLAFERFGELHALVSLTEGDDKQRVRDLQRISNELRGLRPRIAVFSPLPDALARARAARLQAINSNSEPGLKSLSRWITRQVPIPGHEEPPATGGTHTRTILGGKGRGGSGKPLAVCLGKDASATLISLCTHRPQHAWVFYDAETPAVVEVGRRLFEQLRYIPVGIVQMIPTDIMGRGITDAVAHEHAAGKELRADITPGTKSQGCALARIPEAELWSLHGDQGEARCLSVQTQRPLALQAPDILTQAAVVGGRLRNKGHPADRREDFLQLLARFLARYVEEQGVDRIQLRDLIQCRNGELRVTKDSVKVRLDGSQRQGEVKTVGGYWLEMLTAHAFLSAGADQARYGVKWSWPEGIEAKLRSREQTFRTFKDDVDVLARFQHSFVAASCKAGRVEGRGPACREIEAIAQAGMGRFCVPVLVQPRIQDRAIDLSLKDPRRAALLDLRYLADPQKLHEAIYQKIHSLRG